MMSAELNLQQFSEISIPLELLVTLGTIGGITPRVSSVFLNLSYAHGQV